MFRPQPEYMSILSPCPGHPERSFSPVYEQNKAKDGGSEKQGSHSTEETYHLSKESPDVVKVPGAPEPPDAEEAEKGSPPRALGEHTHLVCRTVSEFISLVLCH